MLKLPIRTWVRNAAAVFAGRYGAVQQQAGQAGCSRQTVYEHARKVEEHLTQPAADLQQLQAENERLRQALAQADRRPSEAASPAEPALRRFAVTAQALGISLRQTEELLGTVLPAEKVPDHATLGRWTEAAGRQAGAVLAVLDPLCTPLVETLCLDEIFFGG